METKYWEVQTEETIKQGTRGIVIVGLDLLAAAKHFTHLHRRSLPEAKNIISIHQVKFDASNGGYVRLGIKSREK